MSATEIPKGTPNGAPMGAATEFEGVAPILRVRDLEASIEYYVRVLGFKVDWGEEGLIASVSRDRCHIFLCEGDQGNSGSWVWIGVGDAGTLFEEYGSTGTKIRNPSTKTKRDPSTTRPALAFASEEKTGRSGRDDRFGVGADERRSVGDEARRRVEADAVVAGFEGGREVGEMNSPLQGLIRGAGGESPAPTNERDDGQ